MSKNSARQTVQAVKEWLAFMKFKPKKRRVDPTYESTMEDVVYIKNFKRK